MFMAKNIDRTRGQEAAFCAGSDKASVPIPASSCHFEVVYMPIDEEKVKELVSMMDNVIEDSSVPKNIRRAVTEARDKLKSDGDVKVRLSSAIYSIEAISEDINMPMHARTQIWTIFSALEGAAQVD